MPYLYGYFILWELPETELVAAWEVISPTFLILIIMPFVETVYMIQPVCSLHLRVSCFTSRKGAEAQRVVTNRSFAFFT
ncbi:MAG: hypothetical protein GY795_07530 [Desulfobacterales bacterium]|nr:hypothetical protein [Desulfobacterales bacterium]